MKIKIVLNAIINVKNVQRVVKTVQVVKKIGNFLNVIVKVIWSRILKQNNVKFNNKNSQISEF